MAVRSSQEDFLLREIRKIGEMIARALGFRSKQELPAARAEIDSAYATLLGPQAPMFRVLDVESVVRLVNDPRKLAVLARLTAVDALSPGMRGKLGAAAACGLTRDCDCRGRGKARPRVSGSDGRAGRASSAVAENRRRSAAARHEQLENRMHRSRTFLR